MRKNKIRPSYDKIRKKVVFWGIAVFAVALLILFRFVPPKIDLFSEGAAVLSINTGRTLFDKNMHERLKPASMTKIMATLLIFEKIEDGTISYSDYVTVSENAVQTYASKAGLRAGERLTVDDMIKCVLLPSGSDALIALAEHIFGSEDELVQAMNQKAAELALDNTRFQNAVGLDNENHFSSAYDTAVMVRELVTRFPKVYSYTSLMSDIIKREDGSDLFIKNTNDMLIYEGVDGFKTGSSPDGGYSLAFTYNKGLKHMIFVVISSRDPQLRRYDCEGLLKAFK